MAVTLQTSWDDGSIHDKSIANLLDRYCVPGVFYITLDYVDEPGYMNWRDIKVLDAVPRLSIGSHTLSHPQDLKLLHDDLLFAEISGSKDLLEATLGHAITSFCYPRGRYDERAVAMLGEAGYLEARTTLVGNIEPPQDPFRIATAVHVFNGRKEYDGKGWLKYALELYDKAYESVEDTVFHLWGHGWEIERDNLWDELETFFKYVGSARGVLR